MDIRYSCNQRDFKRYTTEETRDEFLITDLYQADKVVSVYSHVDRMVTLGCMPVNETVPIDKDIDIWANFGTEYFLERREIGIFNIEHLTHQREAVRMHTAGSQRDHHVTRLHGLIVDDLGFVHDTGGVTGQIVIVGGHHAGVLCGLATDQCSAGLDTSLTNTADDLSDLLGDVLAAGNIV